MKRRGFLSACLAVGCSRRPAEPLSSLRIGVAAPERLSTLPLKIAELLGYFDDEKLTVEFDVFPLGVDTAAALRAGRIDVACNQASFLLRQDEGSARVRGFLSLLRYPGYVIVASPRAVEKRRIEDLAGATIGVVEEDRDSQFLLRYILGRRNVGWDSVKAARFAKPDALVDALHAGKADAGILTEPYVSRLESLAAKLTVLLDLRNAQGVTAAVGAGEYPGPVLSATIDWIGDNRAVCERLARALRRTLLWMTSRTASQVADRVPAEFRHADEGIYVNALVTMLPAFSISGGLTPDGAEALIRVWKYANPEAPPPLAAEEIFTGEFLDLA
jgi:NitT/TauT family transport system substrate-binding protein